MRSIIRKELKLLLKGKGNFFFLIVIPILFIVLFGSVFSGASKSTLTMTYIDQDHSSISNAFVDAIGQVKGFSLKEEPPSSMNAEIQQVKDGSSPLCS